MTLVMIDITILNTCLYYFREINLCLWIFAFYTIAISAGGFVTNVFSHKIKVPEFFLRAFKYGKVSDKEDSNMAKSYINTIISNMEVPKRWFIHFYISSAALAAVSCTQVYRVYSTESINPKWLLTLLDYLTSPYREAVDPTSFVISLLLITQHIFRRLYENLCISIFSSGRINILHYIVGHTHYIGVIVVLLSLGPSFGYSEIKPWRFVTFLDVIGITVSLLGSLIQHLSLCTLASLRKNDKGEINQEAHIIPKGFMFDLVTCPHMFGEILVYVGIFMVLNFHSHWAVILIWVISNQVQVAIMNQQWYKKTFKDYPLKRKAILPYLL